eukprot:7972627-Pyramimonas_sp.AAC.1
MLVFRARSSSAPRGLREVPVLPRVRHLVVGPPAAAPGGAPRGVLGLAAQHVEEHLRLARMG